jgi:hypothetical protein
LRILTHPTWTRNAVEAEPSHDGRRRSQRMSERGEVAAEKLRSAVGVATKQQE